MNIKTLTKRYEKFERLAEVAHRMGCYKTAKKWSLKSDEMLELIRDNLETTAQNDEAIQIKKELASLKEQLKINQREFEKESTRLKMEFELELSALQGSTNQLSFA